MSNSAASWTSLDSKSRRFYHGTRADLKPGDRIQPGTFPQVIQAMKDGIAGLEPIND